VTFYVVTAQLSSSPVNRGSKNDCCFGLTLRFSVHFSAVANHLALFHECVVSRLILERCHYMPRPEYGTFYPELQLQPLSTSPPFGSLSLQVTSGI
jgi:hypothetical protein